MKFRFPIFAFVLMIVFQSCSMHQMFHFNKDYSGTYRMEMDLSQAIMMMTLMDTTGTMADGDIMVEIMNSIDSSQGESKYASINGISNVFMAPEDQVLIISYDFDHLEALNQAQGELENLLGEAGESFGQEMGRSEVSEDEFKKPIPFVLNNKTLTYTINEEKEGVDQESLMEEMDMTDMEGADMNMEEMMQGMGDMFDMTTEFTFDRKIKNIEAEGMEVTSSEKNKLSVKMDFDNLMGDKIKATKLKIKLK